MELTRAPYGRMAPLRPRQRGKVSLSNLPVLNAILDVAEHGGKGRGLPEPFGNGHTIYTRRNRWSKNGVLDRVFAHRQRQRMIRIRGEAMGLDSTRIKGHPEGTGVLKKTAPRASESPGADATPSFFWWPRIPERPLPSRARPATRTMPRRGGSSGSGGRSRRTDRHWSWIGPMKTRKPAGGLPTSASRPGSRRKAVASAPGNTTGNGTGGATRSSAGSGDSRAFAESSRASTSLMSCISDSSSSRWSSIHCVALTRPSQCRFSDCQHETEPGYAVRRPIADGRLDEKRLDRYRKLEAEECRNTETLAERRSRERAFGLQVLNAKQAKTNQERS